MNKTKTVDAARGRWVGVLTALGIDETFLRNRHGPCPMCGGVDRFRFDDKEGNGTWFCNSCGSGRGIELVMKLRGCSFRDACDAIDGVVGNAKMQTRSVSKGDPKSRLARIASELVIPSGDVVSYLSGRGLRVPPGVKMHPGLMYYDDGRPTQKYAAMVGKMVSSDDRAISLHVTYLANGKKAQVPSAKKMLPPVESLNGASVRLYPRAASMAIAEGIETAIAYTMLTGVPCWAATTAVLLTHWKPPEGAEHIIVAGDNDENYVGQHHAYSLADRLHRTGYKVDVALPKKRGTDWCDELNDGAATAG